MRYLLAVLCITFVSSSMFAGETTPTYKMTVKSQINCQDGQCQARGIYCVGGQCYPPIPTRHPLIFVGKREAYASRTLRFFVPRVPARRRVGFIMK